MMSIFKDLIASIFGSKMERGMSMPGMEGVFRKGGGEIAGLKDVMTPEITQAINRPVAGKYADMTQARPDMLRNKIEGNIKSVMNPFEGFYGGIFDNEAKKYTPEMGNKLNKTKLFS